MAQSITSGLPGAIAVGTESGIARSAIPSSYGSLTRTSVVGDKPIIFGQRGVGNTPIGLAAPQCSAASFVQLACPVVRRGTQLCLTCCCVLGEVHQISLNKISYIAIQYILYISPCKVCTIVLD